MRSVLYLFTTLIVMGLAFWAYRENYSTQAAVNEMSGTQHEIAKLREDLGILRAEWAYLNRPDRLRKLVSINESKLHLAPFTSDQFVEVGQVAFPTRLPATPSATLAGTDPDALPIERPAGFPPLKPQERTP